MAENDVLERNEVDEVSNRADDLTHLFCNVCYPELRNQAVMRVAFCGGTYQSRGIPAWLWSAECPMCMEMRDKHRGPVPH